MFWNILKDTSFFSLFKPLIYFQKFLLKNEVSLKLKKKIIILLKSAFLPLQMVLNIFLVFKIVCKYIFHQPYFPLSLPFLQVNILTIYNEQKSCFTCALFIEKKKLEHFILTQTIHIFLLIHFRCFTDKTLEKLLYCLSICDQVKNQNIIF